MVKLKNKNGNKMPAVDIKEKYDTYNINRQQLSALIEEIRQKLQRGKESRERKRKLYFFG